MRSVLSQKLRAAAGCGLASSLPLYPSCRLSSNERFFEEILRFATALLIQDIQMLYSIGFKHFPVIQFPLRYDTKRAAVLTLISYLHIWICVSARKAKRRTVRVHCFCWFCTDELGVSGIGMAILRCRGSFVLGCQNRPQGYQWNHNRKITLQRGGKIPIGIFNLLTSCEFLRGDSSEFAREGKGLWRSDPFTGLRFVSMEVWLA